MDHKHQNGRSVSSVWGSVSANNLVQIKVPKTECDSASVPETKISLELNSKADERMIGSSRVVCKTEAEYKANKLNRSEQCKLESFKYRVVKEKQLSQRQFLQMERTFRLKSAKLLNRIRDIEGVESSRSRPGSYTQPPTARSRYLPQRPSSLPPMGTSGETASSGDCTICSKIQQLIRIYEQEGNKMASTPRESTPQHSTCIFSDEQVRMFISMLETKYFKDVPRLNSKLKETGILNHLDQTVGGGHKMSREEVNLTMARRSVEMRIAEFCQDMDKFNKHHGVIPKKIKDAVEQIRLQNAIISSRPVEPTKHEQIRYEVKQTLNIKS